MKEEVEQRWTEYERLMHGGAYYAAMLRVADISSVRDAVSQEGRENLKKRCLAIKIDLKVSEALGADISINIARVRRILSVGQRWTFEEFLLVITIAVQIDLLIALLKDLGIRINPESPSYLTSEIRKAARGEVNQRAFASAVSAARQNWGLPIKHPLLV